MDVVDNMNNAHIRQQQQHTKISLSLPSAHRTFMVSFNEVYRQTLMCACL